MFDVHAHLADKKFRDDVDQVIARARISGLRGVIVVSEFSSEWPKVLALRDTYPSFIGASLGVHPIQVCSSSCTFQEEQSVGETETHYRLGRTVATAE